MAPDGRSVTRPAVFDALAASGFGEIDNKA